jgi:RHS repeat-associated protein
LQEHVSFNLQPATLNLVYTYGHTLISQDRLEGAVWRTSFYGVDGHNNVRYLTDLNGRVTDTYDYDAYGNLISRTGTTPNNYLFSGEQFDPDLGLYYLRARYHNPDTGRFWTQDSYEGTGTDPSSLHKYTYCANNPVNAWDPSGNFSIAEMGHVGMIGGLSTAVVGSISRGVGAASGGAGWKGSLDAANQGIGDDFTSGFVGGALGYGAGSAAFWVVGKTAPYLLPYTPTFVMAFNRTSAQLSRAWLAAENAWARLETAIVQGSEASIQTAEIALMKARSLVSRCSSQRDALSGKLGLGTGQSGPLVRYAQGPRGLRNIAMAVHEKAGSSIAVRNSAVAVAKVRLSDGRTTYFASGSGGILRPAQRELLLRFGIPEENLLFGAGVRNGFPQLENHAERIIMRNLPDGAIIEEWGISWAGGQKPIPCANCSLSITGNIQY